ncbi:Aste57867_6523 [Aphanomyces stellatus]|uniref:Aste57867_6523 protein n=1 Tax=Aphanomyces stellatus TaxID=120398 RepID=A0A485KFU1_9STRA|nr:hypothetical protein As57867_006506 [Aphanomyces stellatus]VFT83505.1 Aste57867_6523 [Aphanomyces stellatus]
MYQFRTHVSVKVIGVDRSPTTRLETMSKGWISFVFLVLIASTVVCLVIFTILVLAKTYDQVLPIDTNQFINTTAYRMEVSTINTTAPRGTRYISILADICYNINHTTFHGHNLLNVSYDMELSVDSKPCFESYVDKTSACFLSSAYDSAHARTLVSVSWYKDHFNFFSNPDPHNYSSFNATLDVSHTNSNATLTTTFNNSITIRSSYSIAYPVVVDGANHLFTALDVITLIFWISVDRPTPWCDWLPGRCAVLVLLVINVLATNTIMHLFHLVFHSLTSYLATEIWMVTFHAAWLLCPRPHRHAMTRCLLPLPPRPRGCHRCRHVAPSLVFLMLGHGHLARGPRDLDRVALGLSRRRRLDSSHAPRSPLRRVPHQPAHRQHPLRHLV